MVQPLILVVEGDPDIRCLVQEVLCERYRVASVGAAADAMAILNQSLPDVVVIECALPGGGLKTVVGRAEADGVPVLLTSGHPGMISAHVDGNHAFLPKPYRLKELVDTVARLIGMRRLGSGTVAEC